MKLEFDSLKEFTEMVEAMGYVKAPGEHSITVHTRAPFPELLADHPGTAAEPVAPGVAVEQEEAQGNEPAPTEQPEPTKRKRRTKAEMEAARASEAAASTTAPVGPSETTEVAVQNLATPANPFEAAASSTSSSTATEAILNAPNGQAATLAGIAAMQTQSPFDAQTAGESATQVATVVLDPSVSGTVDAATFLETRSLELLTAGEPIKTVEHMHKCRDFIAKHGQAKYLESFPLAGLTATIGTFKPEQCARHQAALEFLSANA